MCGSTLWRIHIRWIIVDTYFVYYAPFEEVGLYCFANVSRWDRLSVYLLVDQIVAAHFLKNYLSQSFHISFICKLVFVDPWPLLTLSLLRQKSRSQWLLCKKWFLLIILRTFYHKAFKFPMLIVLFKTWSLMF